MKYRWLPNTHLKQWSSPLRFERKQRTVNVSDDFRQILPVVCHGSRTGIIGKLSYLWEKCLNMKFTENLKGTKDNYDFE